jgi:phosphate transport system protein
MARHLQTEIEKLKKKILLIGAMVEEAQQKSVKAVLDRNAALARSVIESDKEIDRLEVELEEECLKVLALHQPVAVDLRFIVAILKINNDLERIGDLAVNIAGRAEFLARQERLAIPYDLADMAQAVRGMLKQSLDALVNLDLETASRVCAADDKVDEANRKMYQLVMQAIRDNPDQMESYINMLSVSRYLERIADHATNIAQDAIYFMEGEIVRHHHRN